MKLHVNVFKFMCFIPGIQNSWYLTLIQKLLLNTVQRSSMGFPSFFVLSDLLSCLLSFPVLQLKPFSLHSGCCCYMFLLRLVTANSYPKHNRDTIVTNLLDTSMTLEQFHMSLLSHNYRGDHVWEKQSVHVNKYLPLVNLLILV